MPTYRVTLTETNAYTLDLDAPSAAAAAALALAGMQEVEGYAAFDADSAGDLRVADVARLACESPEHLHDTW